MQTRVINHFCKHVNCKRKYEVQTINFDLHEWEVVKLFRLKSSAKRYAKKLSASNIKRIKPEAENAIFYMDGKRGLITAKKENKPIDFRINNKYSACTNLEIPTDEQFEKAKKMLGQQLTKKYLEEFYTPYKTEEVKCDCGKKDSYCLSEKDVKNYKKEKHVRGGYALMFCWNCLKTRPTVYNKEVTNV